MLFLKQPELKPAASGIQDCGSDHYHSSQYNKYKMMHIMYLHYIYSQTVEPHTGWLINTYQKTFLHFKVWVQTRVLHIWICCSYSPFPARFLEQTYLGFCSGQDVGADLTSSHSVLAALELYREPKRIMSSMLSIIVCK